MIDPEVGHWPGHVLSTEQVGQVDGVGGKALVLESGDLGPSPSSARNELPDLEEPLLSLQALGSAICQMAALHPNLQCAL